MRLIVGAQGVLARNTPSGTGTCGADNHVCTQADAILPNTYGVVQSDVPVLDPAGWYWVRVTYESGQTGWSSGYPPFLNSLSPPQMVQGSSFRIVADYNGPALTSARCVSDGVQSDAVMQLQATTGGQMGTLQCTWKAPTVGNHIQVITAVNANGSAPSTEFQFSVTTAPVPPIPASPMNLRITQLTGTPVTTSGNSPEKEQKK
jgi:hypothetical protein